jgi:hypothetical protein
MMIGSRRRSFRRQRVCRDSLSTIAPHTRRRRLQ